MNYVVIFLIILIIIILIIKCNKTNEHFEINNNIYIIIPCVPKHLKYIPKLLKSINNQTTKPTKVIIELSEASNINEYYEEKYKHHLNNIKLEFDSIKIKQNAAENRNRGIYNLISKNINNDDYILFMDADDIMCKNKIKRMIFIMKKYNASLGLHAYSYDKCSKGNNIKNPEEMAEINKRCNNHIHIDCLNIHHGHITVSGDIIKKIKYNITDQYRRAEDSKFVRDVFDNNFNVVYTDDVLSLYYPDRSAENT